MLLIRWTNKSLTEDNGGGDYLFLFIFAFFTTDQQSHFFVCSQTQDAGLNRIGFLCLNLKNENDDANQAAILFRSSPDDSIGDSIEAKA